MKRILKIIILLFVLEQCVSVNTVTAQIPDTNKAILIDTVCPKSPGYEVAYIDCRSGKLLEAWAKRKEELNQILSSSKDERYVRAINYLVSETNQKINSMENWRFNSLPGAKQRDERYLAEADKREAEERRVASLEKMRSDKEDKIKELAEMKRTGQKDASKCREAKKDLQSCINNAKTSRRGAEVFGTLAGVDTSVIQDTASNVEYACRTLKATITISCAIVGESDFAEVAQEIKYLE
ncbi:MAG: hypothetical protein SFU98_07230, partial [Leptospiraceae bacterium]|nr:hypothetical protein [Leptospiraceae bacterium]